jgi:DNA-binding NarL/FixJ family response regulator
MSRGAELIRVLLADDEQLIRHGFRRLLEMFDDVLVVAESADGEQVLAEIARFDIDVILLDVRMRRMSGLEVLDALKGRAKRPSCLVLTTFDDPELLLEAARRGAAGFVSKDIALEELIAAIRAVAAGANWFQPAVTWGLRQALLRRRNGALAQNCASLTEREIEVVRLMAGGLTNRQIAQSLQTAEGTVKNQVSSILAKMAVGDRTLAVLTAIEAGIV